MAGRAVLVLLVGALVGAAGVVAQTNTPIVFGGCYVSPYVVPLTVGGSPFNVLLDTGSANLNIAGQSCLTCDTSPSYAAQPGGEAYSITYGSGTFELEVNTASVTVGSLSASDVEFSVVTENNNIFASSGGCENAYQGIWGLGYVGTADGPGGNPITPLFDDLVAATGVRDQFSIVTCPGNLYSATKGATIGEFMIGGGSSSYSSSAMQYTPLTGESKYFVELESFTVGGATVQLSGQTFVDSGTTDIILSDACALWQVFSALNELITPPLPTNSGRPGFDNPCGTGSIPLKCFWTSACWVKVEWKKDEPFTINLQGAQVRVDLSSVFQTDPKLGIRQAGIYWVANGGGAGLASNILGLTALHGNQVLFDRANHQLGFAQVTAGCSASGFSSLVTDPATQIDLHGRHTPARAVLPAIIASSVLVALAVIVAVLVIRDQRRQAVYVPVQDVGTTE